MALETLKKNIEAADKKAMEAATGCAKKAAAVEAKPEKSVDEIAQEVIRGLWGSGAERKERLTEAGYDFDAIQKRVNELLK